MISVSAPIVEDPEVGILMKDRDLKGGGRWILPGIPTLRRTHADARDSQEGSALEQRDASDPAGS